MSIWVFIAYVIAHVIFKAVGILAACKKVDRSVERSLRYSTEDLRTAAANGRAYIFPFLFPLDLIVMLALAGSLALAAQYWGSPIWVVPACVYLAFDLAEDGLLVLMLSGHVPISDRTVPVLKVLTGIKLLTVWIAEFIALAAFAVALGHWLGWLS